MVMTQPLLSPVDEDSHVPLREQVYEKLREAILAGLLQPGEHLGEDRLCRMLGTSRSPLREALRRLEAEGLVRLTPRRGAITSEITMSDLSGLFAVRRALEVLAAETAAARITAEELAQVESICSAMQRAVDTQDMAAIPILNTQFHALITELSRNKWLIHFMSSLKAHISRIYRSSIETPDRARQSISEHLAILEALRDHNPESAGRMARVHVEHAQAAAESGKVADKED
jgi:DNA-binding GntR family transcriptional regulator